MLQDHLFQVSEWSAHCTTHDQPRSCTNALQNPGTPPNGRKNNDGTDPIYAWTNLTYLLHRAGVSWGYYVVAGTEPDCADDEAVDCAPVKQNARTPGIWNPLPYFDAVSWIAPSGDVSEHPPARITAGQAYVTSLVNGVMKSPDWDSTAIVLSRDDWGGFYDTSPHPPSTPTDTGCGYRAWSSARTRGPGTSTTRRCPSTTSSVTCCRTSTSPGHRDRRYRYPSTPPPPCGSPYRGSSVSRRVGRGGG